MKIWVFGEEVTRLLPFHGIGPDTRKCFKLVPGQDLKAKPSQIFTQNFGPIVVKGEKYDIIVLNKELKVLTEVLYDNKLWNAEISTFGDEAELVLKPIL